MGSRPDYLNLPFLQAITYFNRKQVFPSESKTQFQEGMHNHAFIVQGLTKASLLEDTKWLVNKALTQGTSLDDFTATFNRLIGRKGWRPGGDRIKKIYVTNLAQSSRGGRYQQLLDLYQRKPQGDWMWKHRTPAPEFGGTPRDEHKELDGKVFRPTETFWKTAFPPCAWGCRCMVVWLSDEQMERMGKTFGTPPDPKSIADPGFRYTPNNFDKNERSLVLKDGLKRLSPELRKVTARSLKAKGVI